MFYANIFGRMEKFMEKINKNSKITFSQRVTIESMIQNRKKKSKIADVINKSKSTVSREILPQMGKVGPD